MNVALFCHTVGSGTAQTSHAAGSMWGSVGMGMGPAATGSTSPSLQEQLRRLYPRLKVLALGARPETMLHTYFPSFLSRATPSCPPAMKKEVRRGLGVPGLCASCGRCGSSRYGSPCSS